MYSLVLMAAMTQGAAAPAWQMDTAGPAGTTFLNAAAHEHYRHGCHGCCGCWGGCYGGWSCCGCYGGWSCYGCYGGWSCYGCYGGYAVAYGGAPYGGYAYGGYTTGMPYAYGAPYGTTYTYGSGYSGNVMPMPAPEGTERGTRGNERGTERSTERGSERSNRPEALAPAPATLIVSLPADARLTVDGYQTRSSSSVRTFVSPPLTPGRDFHYNLTASFLRDGKPVTVEKNVTVRAGEQTRVNLENAPAQVASR